MRIKYCNINSFKVEMSVGQGCPLATYLFLIVGGVLIHLITKAVSDGRLKGITLPGGKKQQSISQYADNSSFMVRGEKQYVDKLVRLLKLFSEASGMEINWEKSSVYWLINLLTNQYDLTGMVEMGRGWRPV